MDARASALKTRSRCRRQRFARKSCLIVKVIAALKSRCYTDGETPIHQRRSDVRVATERLYLLWIFSALSVSVSHQTTAPCPIDKTPAAMSGWFSPPPVVTSRHVADVPKELYCSEQSEWVLRE